MTEKRETQVCPNCRRLNEVYPYPTRCTRCSHLLPSKTQAVPRFKTFHEAVKETMTLAEKYLGHPLTEDQKQSITQGEKGVRAATFAIRHGYTASPR